MFKAIGAACVLVSCSGLGFAMARAFRNRPKHLRQMSQAFRILQGEIQYSATPLAPALSRVATRVSAPIDGVFQTASDVLKDSQGAVDEAFAAGIRAKERQLALLEQDLAVVQEFVRTLGVSDRTHQVMELEAVQQRLTALEEEAVEAERKNARMWRYLGALTGLMLVILLF